MADRDKQGLNGAGSEEPAAAKSGNGPGGLAAAVESAAKAEELLGQATERRQRLNLNDPAVQAAKAAAEATDARTAAEERLARATDARVKAAAGLSTGAGVSRKNDLLDEAFGEPGRSHRPQGEKAAAGADPKMAEALRAERELADAMRGRLGLARTLAGTPSVPPSAAGGAKGYAGAAAVGGERPGVSAREASLERLEARAKGGTVARRELDLSDARASDGGGTAIHDEGRAGRDRKRRAEQQEQFAADLAAKRGEEARGPGIVGATRTVLGAAGGALSMLGGAAQQATQLVQTHTAPFITEQDRFWQKAGAVPGVSLLRGWQEKLQQVGSGKTEYAHRMKVFDLESYDDAYRRPTEAFGARWETDRREADARVQASGRGGFRLPDPSRPDVSREVLRPALPATDRETLGAARRFREETALVSPKDAEYRAKQEVYALTQRTFELDRQRARQSGEIARLEEVRAAALRRADVDQRDGGFAKREDLATAADADRGIVTHRSRLREMDDEKRELDERTARARGGERDAGRAVMGVQLDQYREREGTARGQAQRLGMMGVEGRMQAILAKQIVDQIGAENAPAALLGDYAAAFPETARKDAETAGQRFQPQFQQLAPEEYQDAVPQITKKVDEMTAALRAQEQKDSATSFLELLRAVEGMVSRNQRYAEELAALKKLFETESTIKNSR